MERIILVLLLAIGLCVILCNSSEIDVNLLHEISERNATAAEIINSSLSELVEEFRSTTAAPPSTTTTPAVNEQELLIPPATVNANIAQMHHTAPRKRGPIVISSEPDCPSLENADELSQTQLLKTLTHGCRYDRLERPIHYGENNTRLPVDVFARAYIYFIQNLEAHDLQFKIHVLLQMRYVDPRLVFREVAPNRHESIMGEASLRQSLWVPHVFLANERSSSILGTNEKDILTSISPDGTVIVSTRIQAQLYCWMNLQKFPFDEQHCQMILESWMYNTSELVLHWEQKSPVTLAPELHLTEYVLLNMWTNETMINADLSDLRHGAFAGNYSSLTFTIHLAREMGFYLMDYFIPSMMIVAISWVSFWLQADQSPPRIMLGTSTMLTFITLASAQGKTLPKVSYIKASEVWFLACTGFIFGSLVEFAFVNTIWRRKRNVELKKVNSKYILKSTLTPRPQRKEIGGNLQKSHSCSSLDAQSITTAAPSYNNYLTVHSFSNNKINLPIITTQSCDDLTQDNGTVINVEPDSSSTLQGNSAMPSPQPQNTGWTTMTPQEIAMWIDRRSRFLFPCAFLVFNIFYWSFVYCL
ncbi:pH-sensitive chloride channel 2 [Phlebotomus argentipes]|uniref:pH-sensitive chloride channel 2 n=1 Tax=Phlebotomus argentipes TaxID=94469 RepID=UPI002893069E|nr:pH-sensitive chloride channel 2 [Phlebotomus argentipes]